jgi:hypothetical protein
VCVRVRAFACLIPSVIHTTHAGDQPHRRGQVSGHLTGGVRGLLPLPLNEVRGRVCMLLLFGGRGEGGWWLFSCAISSWSHYVTLLGWVYGNLRVCRAWSQLVGSNLSELFIYGEVTTACVTYCRPYALLPHVRMIAKARSLQTRGHARTHAYARVSQTMDRPRRSAGGWPPRSKVCWRDCHASRSLDDTRLKLSAHVHAHVAQSCIYTRMHTSIRTP